MTRPIKTPAVLQPYHDELQAYELRFAAWLGLDPHVVMNLKEQKRPVNADGSALPAPPDLDVTWEAFEQGQEADEHPGRYRHPFSIRSTGDDDPIFTFGVQLSWFEVERLRAEVGERPQMPAPAGGWPAHWPQP